MESFLFLKSILFLLLCEIGFLKGYTDILKKSTKTAKKQRIA